MHLTILTDDEQIAEVCRDYWQLNDQGKFEYKVKAIAKRHGLDQYKLPQIVREASFISISEIACPRCGKEYRFCSRCQLAGKLRFIKQICSQCQAEKEQTIADRKNALLGQIRKASENKKPDLSTLGLKIKLFLLAAAQGLGDENLESIHPLIDSPQCSLSPEHNYDCRILKELFDQHIILPSLGNSPDIIVLNSDNGVRIVLAQCVFNPTYTRDELIILIEKLCEDTARDWTIVKGEFLNLCREIQLSECLAFLRRTIESHRLYFSPGTKTTLTLDKCLDHYSVSQVYNFIWRAGKDAAAYYMRSPASKRRAANSVVGNIARSYERSRANDWEVKSFRRNYNLPQSTLSRIVFNTMLSTDDGGFERPLHELVQPDLPVLD